MRRGVWRVLSFIEVRIVMTAVLATGCANHQRQQKPCDLASSIVSQRSKRGCHGRI